MVSTTSMFVSCKDYDDDVQNLQNQINNLDGTVTKSITTLQASLTALDAAYKSGDDATLAAAKQAVADAKAALEASLASKSEVNALESAVIKAQESVDQALKLLDDKASKADLASVQGDLSTVQTALTNVQTDLQTAIASITTMQEDVKNALKELSELSTAINGQLAALETVADGAKAVTTNIQDLQARTAELEKNVAVLAGQDPTQPTDLTGINAELSDLRQQVLELAAKINENPGSEYNTIVIALSKALRSLVFIPHLYLDGIESIEYPWIGDTILKKETTADIQNLGHHFNAAGVKHDLSGEKDDYLPNTLGRWYNRTTGQIETDGYDKKTRVAITNDREWIYGPVWPVQYELNPSTALVDYATNAPAFKVLEPDVVYYNTRATASALNVTSPEKYEYYNQDVNVFGAANGVLTVGLKIANPNLLAPWPTDDTINPNGYPASTTAPATDAYTNAEYGTYSSWYGFASYKYNSSNKDNTLALQMNNTDSENGRITSDYALIVPSRIQLEGLVWAKVPQYIEPDFGPGNRRGDEEGWATGVGYDCNTSRVHVWDSPEEAIADPDGAALELYALDVAGVDLTQYLGIHAVKENIFRKETAPGVFDGLPYDLLTLRYGEEKKYGLHYEFELVQWLRNQEVTSDSRFATFSDWTDDANTGLVSNWNQVTSKTGVIIARNINAAGQTTTEQSASAVDREPLVRVLVKNAGGDVLLDGYILLHINHTPDNLYVDNYPEESKTFDLCENITLSTTWSQFSRYILTDKLQLTNKETGTERLAFDDWYWADCMEDPAGMAVGVEDAEFVTPAAYKVGAQDNKHNFYQLKIFNFGDIYGNAGGGIATPPTKGSANPATSNEFEDKALGVATYYPYSAGTSDHRFSWTLSKEEVEYLTHDKSNLGPITVTRWIRFIAKDLVRGRSVNNYSAPYPYIWVKMTMNITRTTLSDKFAVKNDNYWYGWDTGASSEWSATIFDIQAPRDGFYIDAFANGIHQTLVGNMENTSGTPGLGKVGTTVITNPALESTATSWGNLHKYFFAPKDVVVGDRTITAYHPTDQNNFNKLFCNYVVRNSTYVNLPGVSYLPDPATIIANTDSHSFNPAMKAGNTWEWDLNYKDVLEKCAVSYTQGAFTNKYLYSVPTSKRSSNNANDYIRIAELNQVTGEIQLLQSPAASFEEAKYVLNLVGYKDDKHGNINEELRTWWSIVSTNACGVASKVVDFEHTPELRSFMTSWQRPINLEDIPAQIGLDANTNENWFYMVDLLKLFDWRGPESLGKQGYMYNDHQWFWAYYRVNAITIDMRPTSVMTNMHSGTWKQLSQISKEVDLTAYVSDNPDVRAYINGNLQAPGQYANQVRYEFNLIDPSPSVGYQWESRNDDLIAYMGIDPVDNLKKSVFGAIYYQNNGVNVTEFDVRIPITIEYYWGKFSSTFEIHFNTVHGNENN